MNIVTSDNKVLTEGNRAFNHYDMAAGNISHISEYAQPDTMKGQSSSTPVEEWTNHWFDFVQDDGRIVSLDGSRICSIEFAIRKGWYK